MSKLIFSFFLIAFNISFADQSPVKIREFKYYREFSVGKDTFLISKKNNFIVFNSGKKRLTVSKFHKFSLYTFNEFNRDMDRFVFFKKPIDKKSSIGMYSRKASIFFKSECDVSSAFKKNLDQMTSPEFLDKIQQMKVTNLLDEKSCSGVKPDQLDKLKRVLIDALSAQRLKFGACFKSKYAQEIFGKDMLLLQNSTEVFGRYLDLIDQISSNGTSLKIKCGIPDGQNRIASFSENPLVIALNTVNQEFNLGLTDIEASVNHELLHYGVRQFETERNSKCMNEGFTELLEAACKYKPNVGVQAPPSGEEIRNKCLKDELVKIETQKDAKNGGDKGIEVVAQVANLPLENRAENQIGTEHLIETINSGKPMFETVPESVVQVAASTPITTTSGQPISAFEGDGQFHAVVADSSFNQSIQAIASSLSASASNVSNAIGGVGMVAAAAMVGNRAVASTSNFGSVSSSGTTSAPKGAFVSPMTSTEAFLNRYYPENSEVQDVLSQPKLDNMTYDEKETYFRSLESTTSLVSAKAETSPAFKDGMNGLNKVNKTQENNAPIAKTSSGRSIASLEAPQTVEVDDEKSIKAKAENANLAATSAQSVSNGVPKLEGRLDNAIIQRLSVFKDVREPAYSRVTERFSDSTFLKQLDARRIQIVNEQGKPLWISSSHPEKCFRDNKTTKVIEKIPCK